MLAAAGVMRRGSNHLNVDKSTTLKIRTISKAAAKDRLLSRRLAHWKARSGIFVYCCWPRQYVVLESEVAMPSTTKFVCFRPSRPPEYARL